MRWPRGVAEHQPVAGHHPAQGRPGEEQAGERDREGGAEERRDDERACHDGVGDAVHRGDREDEIADDAGAIDAAPAREKLLLADRPAPDERDRDRAADEDREPQRQRRAVERHRRAGDQIGEEGRDRRREHGRDRPSRSGSSDGSMPRSAATAGPDRIGGAAPMIASPSTMPGSSDSRPTSVSAPPISTAGAKVSHRQAIASRRGRRRMRRMIDRSARAKVSVMKVKMQTLSSGRAVAATPGSARPRKMLTTKPCVP